MSSTVTYMLGWGDHYERGSSGPFLGPVGLDFAALSAEYRRERYAEANIAMKDHCWLSEEDFCSWLLQKGILTPVESTHVELDIRTSGDEAFVPLHWPECPQCSRGRGEQEYGMLRRSLNRITAFRRCTECRHEWGHVDEPNDSKRPMIEDDGRDTTGGCVPFAISKACGVEWNTVKAICARYGWTENGMNTPHNAALAIRELGYDLVAVDVPRNGLSKPTLKQVATQLSTARSYIIGIRGHWLAVVNGRIIDNDNNSGMTSRVVELYEVRKQQAVAA
ncbi:hypothetical protein ACTOWA_00540 [Herbaspirillum seropedicae]|uniref:hypothetical protein n=1 Tax=Herbaspirillum seropedicae TaxID=964 RepID=UPI0028646215|nr:hypothetical protein [Herbaspirillum seropedicae]MDR6397919.1 hypothetical protein [Herbaspirillum seropedicae]